MLRNRGRRLQNRRGAVLVLVSILSVVLLLFMAFALDASRLYVQKNELQTAADAGALAGVLDLAKSPGTLKDSAVQAANRNKVLNNTIATTTADVSCGSWNDDPASNSYGFDANTGSDCGAAANAVRVATSDNSRYLFGALLNAAGVRLGVSAVAWAAPTIDGSGCIKPFAVPYQVLISVLKRQRLAMGADSGADGRELDATDLNILATNPQSLRFCLKEGGGNACSNGTTEYPGNFNAVSLKPGDNGAPAYLDNIRRPCDQNPVVIRIGDALEVRTGNIAGDTQKGLNDWCALSGTGPCFMKLILWEGTPVLPKTATDGVQCKAGLTGSGWCVTVRQIGAAVVNSAGATGQNRGVIEGYFTLLNDAGATIGGPGTKPGLLRRMILVQ